MNWCPHMGAVVRDSSWQSHKARNDLSLTTRLLHRRATWSSVPLFSFSHRVIWAADKLCKGIYIWTRAQNLPFTRRIASLGTYMYLGDVPGEGDRNLPPDPSSRSWYLGFPNRSLIPKWLFLCPVWSVDRTLLITQLAFQLFPDAARSHLVNNIQGQKS